MCYQLEFLFFIESSFGSCPVTSIHAKHKILLMPKEETVFDMFEALY
jgi:hypothetical protein